MRQRHPLELPDGVVQQEVENMLRTYADEMARRGIDLEKADFDWQALAERERPNAEKRVHARLLLDAAAEKEGTEVDEQEFEQVLAQLARAEGRTTGAVRQALDRSGRLGESARAPAAREAAAAAARRGDDTRAPTETAGERRRTPTKRGVAQRC